MTSKHISKVITTPEGRVSFPNLFVPVAPENGQGKAKYSATILIEKTNPEIQKFLQEVGAEIQAAVEAEWPNAQKRPDIKALPKALKDGDTLKFEKGEKMGRLKKEQYPEMAGCWVLQTSGVKKPTVIDRSGNPILDESAIESGMVIRLMCHFYVCNTAQFCGVSCGLDHALLVRDDGVRFGGSAPAATEGFAAFLGGDTGVAAAPAAGVQQVGSESMFG